MQIVIDIPKRIIEHIKDGIFEASLYDRLTLVVAVMNGTPLPKGHGDLVDRDAVNKRFYDIWNELECYSNQPTYKELLDKWGVCMDTAPAIIEADEER